MNSEQLDKLLHIDAKLGARSIVCSSDTLYSLLMSEKYDYFIINTEPSYKKGVHWVAFSINSGEFFDSFGHSPLFYGTYFEKVFGKLNIKYNSQPLQCQTSSTCGLFCIYFILLKFKKYSLKSIIDSFTTNCNINEKQVKTYIRKFITSNLH